MTMGNTGITTHWQCPGCGHLITNAVYCVAQIDIQCGGCRDYKLSTFESVHIISTGEEGRKIGE